MPSSAGEPAGEHLDDLGAGVRLGDQRAEVGGGVGVAVAGEDHASFEVEHEVGVALVHAPVHRVAVEDGVAAEARVGDGDARAPVDGLEHDGHVDPDLGRRRPLAVAQQLVVLDLRDLEVHRPPGVAASPRVLLVARSNFFTNHCVSSSKSVNARKARSGGTDTEKVRS